MNREIKFRAWNDNKMEYLSLGDKNPLISRLHVALFSDFIRGKPEILMQFTGLKDKNGKEIYEGDMCKIHIFTQELGENLGVIEGEREFIGKISIESFGITINEEPLFCYGGFHEESLEVVGNIYENPELIKQM